MKYLARDDFLEMHQTAAQPRLGGRAPIVPQAKALGGGSAVNAMVYMRGQREDYDGWDAYLGAAPAGPTRTSCRISARWSATPSSTTATTGSTAGSSSPIPAPSATRRRTIS